MTEILNKVDEVRTNAAKAREQIILLEELKMGSIDLNEYIKLMELLNK